MPSQKENGNNLVKMYAPNDPDKDQRIVQLDPILEAEARHGPVFRRDLFDVAYAAYQFLNLCSLEELRDKHQNEITLRNIYGNDSTGRAMMGGDLSDHGSRLQVSQRAMMYNSIQSLGFAYGQRSEDRLCSYSLGVRYVDAKQEDCFSPNTLEEQGKAWAQEWRASEMYQRLTDFMQQHAGKLMQNVDKIVCFGLGCLNAQRGKRAYMQHLAACTVRDILARQQPGEQAPKVVTQDPDYCAAGKAYVAKHFDMLVLDDPEGFKLLDGHSFVLSFGPNVPVRQIVWGLTHEFGGPAGMFCDNIATKGLECNGKGSTNEDGRRVAPYCTCESSPALWKYKQDSTWMEYSDREGDNWFGRPGIYLKQKS